MSSESSSKVKLIAIPPGEVEQAWPLAGPLLEKAIALTNKADLGNVFLDLELANAQLWLVWSVEESAALAALVTELSDYPSGWRTVRVIALGGSRLHEWKHLIESIEEYAVAERADAVELVGRAGWGRLFPGYEEIERTYAREVGHGHRRQ